MSISIVNSNNTSTSNSQRNKFIRMQWLVFALVIGTYMMSFFHRVAPIALGSYLQADFSASSTQLGLIAAMYFVMVTVMQVPTGIIADTIGPRKILVLGCITASIGSAIFAAATTIPVACVGRALIGMGVAVPFVALLKLNASWFAPRQFATLSGLTILFGNLGSILSTYPLSVLSQYVDWRFIIAGTGLLTLCLGLIIWLYVCDTPETAGFTTDATGLPPAPRRPVNLSWLKQLGIVMRNSATWPCFWVGFGICGTFFTFTSLWAVPFLTKTYGMTKDMASSHVLVMLLSHAVTAIFIGRLSDKLANRKTLLLGLGSIYVLMWLPMFADAMKNPWLSFAVFAVQGVGSTSYTLIWALAKEVNPPESAGMAIGVANTSMFLATALLQPLIGRIIDINPGHGLQYGVLLLAVIAAGGLIAGVRIIETHARNIFPQRA
jgi:MFS family permease